MIHFLILYLISLCLCETPPKECEKGKDDDFVKVTKLTLWHVSVPLKNTFYPSWIPGYPQTHNKFNLLEVETDKGYKGYSASTAFAREVDGLGSLLGPYLIGKNALDIESVHHLLIEASFLGWRNFWVENAFYDIIAQHKGVPFHKLYGGSSDPIPVYLSTGSVCRPEYHAEIVNEAEKQGFNGVKIRIKFPTVEEDINTVKELRKRINNPDFPIMIDANQGWRVTIMDDNPEWDVERAAKFIDGIKDMNVAWLEEPLEMHRYEDYATLRARSSIPICGAELNYGWNEIRFFLKYDSLDVYQPDASFSGIYDTLKVIDAAKELGRKFSPHTWTNGIGLLMNLQLYGLTDRELPLEFPLEKDTWTPEYRDGILKNPIMAVNGTIELPCDPGLGIKERIDWDALEKHGEKVFEITQKGILMNLVKEKGIMNSMKIIWKKLFN